MSIFHGPIFTYRYITYRIGIINGKTGRLIRWIRTRTCSWKTRVIYLRWRSDSFIEIIIIIFGRQER